VTKGPTCGGRRPDHGHRSLRAAADGPVGPGRSARAAGSTPCAPACRAGYDA